MKNNAWASTVSHAEDCLYSLETKLLDEEQRERLALAKEALMDLYVSLREEE